MPHFGIPLDIANFLGLILASILYGIYLQMFFSVIGALYARRSTGRVVFILTCLILIITTVNMGILAADNYMAFITYRQQAAPAPIGGTVLYFYNYWRLTTGLRIIFIALGGSLADLLLVWRLYIVWEKDKRLVVLPIGALITQTVLFMLQGVEALAHPKSPLHNTMSTEIATYSCTIFLSLYCTGLIVGRIWWIGYRVTSGVTRNMYTTILITLMETGLLHTVTIVLYFILLLVPGVLGVFSFMSCIISMIVAISPMLIVLRVRDSRDPDHIVSTQQIRHSTDFSSASKSSGTAFSIAKLSSRSRRVTTPRMSNWDSLELGSIPGPDDHQASLHTLDDRQLATWAEDTRKRSPPPPLAAAIGPLRHVDVEEV